MHVIGHFRDLDAPDRYVWLRGFRRWQARREALAGFYFGPVWQRHRDAANATMVDSDNVLAAQGRRTQHRAWRRVDAAAGHRRHHAGGRGVASARARCARRRRRASPALRAAAGAEVPTTPSAIEVMPCCGRESMIARHDRDVVGIARDVADESCGRSSACRSG
jgi:hypothetical protein